MAKPNYRLLGDARDGTLVKPRSFTIDLSVARTLNGAGVNASLDLAVAGNSMYFDANPTDGNAFLFAQFDNTDNSETRLYVSPGAIFEFPFTRLRFINTAQPGKFLTLVYGVDITFQPGSVAQVAISIASGVAVQLYPYAESLNGRAFASGGSSGAAAGFVTNVGIFNPVGSGVVTTIQSLRLSSSLAAPAAKIITISTIGNFTVGGFLPNQRVGGAASKSHIISLNAAAPTAVQVNASLHVMILPAGVDTIIALDSPIVLPPGFGYFFTPNLVNSAVTLSQVITEDPA